MGLKYLSVDSNAEKAEYESIIWREEKDIGMERVDTMTEGIAKLQRHNYFFVGINSDVVEFLPLIGVMKSMTNTPLFVGTSNYTHERQAEALTSGADMYGEFRDTQGNMESIMANIKAKTRNSDVFVHMSVCSDIIVTETRDVYVGNKQPKLFPKEIELLRLLMQYDGEIVPTSTILRIVWHEEGLNPADDPDLVRKTVSRLKVALSEVSNRDYIKTEYKKGYRFIK